MVVTVGAETAILFFGVPFARMASLVTVAFGGILLWMAGLSVAGLVGGALPAGLGWLGVAMVALAIVHGRGEAARFGCCLISW